MIMLWFIITIPWIVLSRPISRFFRVPELLVVALPMLAYLTAIVIVNI